MTQRGTARKTLGRLFEAAVAAGDPARLVSRRLPPMPVGRTAVVAAGKAAASMARAFEDAWPGPVEGIAITRHGHGMPCRQIEVVEAGHPRPSYAGEAAARRALALCRELEASDLLVALMSGGGSSLLALPAEGISLDDKRSVADQLLRSGAAIGEINAVRKHLSAVKGGRLAAAAHPAAVWTLAISDVAGDDPAVIASGPTVADPTTYADALAVADCYQLRLPDSVRGRFARGEDETPKPGDARLAEGAFHILATGEDAIAAAASAARENGLKPVSLGAAIEGDAREAAAAMARRVREAGHGAALLSGGELTVQVEGEGSGGPNREFLLALAIELGGMPGIYAIACDTDGIDGAGEAAGAIIDPDTLARVSALGMDVRQAQKSNDTGSVFAALGDEVVTGPTRTNLNDFRAIIAV